jgi:uncharacterized DUF497 family protein
MLFEWDEAKRLSNITKHGLDFVRAQRVFDDRPRMTVESSRGEEQRFLSIASLDAVLVALTWTVRDDDTIRIISVRRARDAEKRQYRQLYG